MSLDSIPRIRSTLRKHIYRVLAKVQESTQRIPYSYKPGSKPSMTAMSLAEYLFDPNECHYFCRLFSQPETLYHLCLTGWHKACFEAWLKLNGCKGCCEWRRRKFEDPSRLAAQTASLANCATICSQCGRVMCLGACRIWE